MSWHAVAFPHEQRMNRRFTSASQVLAVRDTTSQMLQEPSSARYEALTRVLHAIASYPDLAELLPQLARELAEIVAFDAIGVAECDEVSKRVSWHSAKVATSGMENRPRAWIYEHQEASGDEGDVHQIFETGQPCASVGSATGALIPNEPFLSVSAQPLFRGNRALGFLVLGRTQYQPFTRDEEAFLRQIAKPVAIAVETVLAGERITTLQEALAEKKLYSNAMEGKRSAERARNENLALREHIDQNSMFEDIVGSSEALRSVLRQISKVAGCDSTVLILGETGTGKELVARAIHKRSTRSHGAFIAVNCAAIPPSLIASELFGHEKGSFTGATERRLGRFESASGGTIFLDEVGDLPPEIQIALLRVLQEREIERVGSNRTISVDVRVVAATHRDLDALVAEGKFRQDLYYRLNVVPIRMPSLRERADDIPVLVEYFVDRFGKKAGKRFRTMDKATAELFEVYEWPGNVRELQNVIERAVILSEGEIFHVEQAWLKRLTAKSTGSILAFNNALQRQEKDMIEAALATTGGRVSGPGGAATKLGLPRATLDAKIKRLGINKYQFRVQQPA